MVLEHSPFLLTKIEHDSTIFPPLLLAYTFDVLDHIRQHNQLNTIRYSLCTMHCVLFDIYYALCTMHYALFDIYYALYIMHYALCTVYCALCTMHTYLCVFIHIYYFIHIYMYSLFHMEIRRNPVILVLTRSSRRIK